MKIEKRGISKSFIKDFHSTIKKAMILKMDFWMLNIQQHNTDLLQLVFLLLFLVWLFMRAVATFLALLFGVSDAEIS